MDQTNSQILRSDDTGDGDPTAMRRAGAWIGKHSIGAHHAGARPAHPLGKGRDRRTEVRKRSRPAHAARERSLLSNHNGWCDDRASLSRQLSIIQEMLRTFDTLTTAGQRYAMSKIVAFGRDQVSRACDRVSPFADLIDELDRESARWLPDFSRFVERVERLVGLLASTA
jgi:hypothetical protein